MDWTWIANGAYEILRHDNKHLLARTIEIGRDRFRWRAFNGTEYVEGECATEAQAKAAALQVAKEPA
jgi:hypothetical protein